MSQPDLNPSVRRIQADLDRPAGPHAKTFRRCVGAGRAHEGLRAAWQDQLRLVRAECGFEYLRFHGLLHDDMGVFQLDGSGRPVLNFQYIDMLYDALLAIGIRPFVELSFMPQALASGSKTVFWWRANVTAPNSYEHWNLLIRRLVEHWLDRYGLDEVQRWYFEIWNEPNHEAFFYSNRFEDYLPLYANTAKTIKAVHPSLRVGGPATAGNAWADLLIDACVSENLPLDFISTHTYATYGAQFDESGTTQVVLSTDLQAIANDVRRVRAQINASRRPDLELHYTEWSSSYSPRDPIHDHYFSAPFILEQIKHAEHLAQSLSYWVFTDIFEEAGVPPTPFHGGFGLLNLQGIRKPAFFAFQFLHRLGDIELQNTDPRSWICCDDQGNVQALWWDIDHPIPDGRTPTAKFFRQLRPPVSAAPVRLEIRNLAPGRYQMEVYRVGFQINDPYSLYLAWGEPPVLSRHQEQLLHAAASGRPVSVETIQIEPGQSFDRTFPMRQNDVYLLTLKRC